MGNIYDIYALKVKNAIALRKKNAAIAAFCEGMRGDEHEFLKAAKKIGAFRSSNYQFKTSVLEAVLSSPDRRKPNITITKHTSDYFKSLYSLYFIAHSIRDVYQNILEEMRVKSLKSYLASLDALFCFPRYEICANALHRGVDGFSAEDFGIAFSYYYFQLTTKYQPATIPLLDVEEQNICNGYYLNRLKDACCIWSFREAEILVDCFDYTASKSGKSVTIKASVPIIEKSMRLGYIRSETQTMADRIILENQISAQSLQSFCEIFHDKLGDYVFEVKMTPKPRIVLQVPDAPFLREMLSGEALFKEEAIQLSIIEKELLLTKEQIYKKPFSGSLTIFDIIKFQRFFRFLLWSFKRYIEKNKLQSSPLFYKSLIPINRNTAFRDQMARVFEKTKAQELLDLFTWSPESSSVFDIQTQPIVKCGEWIALPMGVLAESNLVRNILILLKFRFDSESAIDPIGNELERVFKTTACPFKRNISYRYNNQEGEIDFLYLSGNHLFLCECKNSLHPCNPFELRTSYDYIRKAASQLSKLTQLFNDLQFRLHIESLSGITFPPTVNLHTCIVSGNRMFSGLVESGHPVRPVYEMCNFITSGNMRVHTTSARPSGGTTTDFSLWASDHFTPDDLVAYLSINPLYSSRFDAMHPCYKELQIKYTKLVYETYILNSEEQIANFKQSYKWQTHNTADTVPDPSCD